MGRGGGSPDKGLPEQGLVSVPAQPEQIGGSLREPFWAEGVSPSVTRGLNADECLSR